MNPLVNLLKRLRDKAARSPSAGSPSAGETASAVPDRRDAPRFDVDHAVLVRREGLVPVAGTLINLSRSGAAIRIHGWHVPVPGAWPVRLKHGDEVELGDLLDEPVPCWVIAVEEGVLRVRFLVGEATRTKLREKYPILSAS
jgi:PilZ domain